MMREPVVIVLNEREPGKLRAAEELHTTLATYGITSSRVEISEDIIDVIKSRHPRILVLDYLLGDYSTGPDVMSAFDSVRTDKRPRFFFLTDEPSVQVAVNAILKGALNYFEIDNADSVKRLAAEIYDCLRQEKIPQRASMEHSPSLDDLVANAKRSRQLIERVRSIVKQRAPIILFVGPVGSGLSTLSLGAENESGHSCFVKTIDLRFFSESLGDLVGVRRYSAQQLCLGDNLLLIVENVDQDGGELLELLQKHRSRLWPDGKSSELGSRIIVSTNDPETASAWSQLLKAEVVNVPALCERTDDIPAMIQRFVRETEEIVGKKVRAIPSDIIQWLASLDWPGNIRELRACVIDALICSVASDNSLRELLEGSRELSAQGQIASSKTSVDPLVAAAILETSNMSYRVAAAKLGLSVRGLYHCIHGNGELVQ